MSLCVNVSSNCQCLIQFQSVQYMLVYEYIEIHLRACIGDAILLYILINDNSNNSSSMCYKHNGVIQENETTKYVDLNLVEYTLNERNGIFNGIHTCIKNLILERS
eukprot:319016_1